MSLLRSSMRCARRSPGVARRPDPLSGSAVRSCPGCSVSVLEYTRLFGRAETRRPDLLPGTGAFVRSPQHRHRRVSALPWRSPTGRWSPGPTAPVATSAPVHWTGREAPLQAVLPAPPKGRDAVEHHGAHRPGGDRPRCSPKHRGHPWVGPSHQYAPTVAAGPSRDRGTSEEPRWRTRRSPSRTGPTGVRSHRSRSTVFRGGPTSSSALSDGLGHGLPMATFAALTIVEGASFPLRRDASRL